MRSNMDLIPSNNVTIIPATCGSRQRTAEGQAAMVKGRWDAGLNRWWAFFPGEKQQNTCPQGPERRSPMVNFLNLTWGERKQRTPGAGFKKPQGRDRAPHREVSLKGPAAMQSRSPVYPNQNRNQLCHGQGPGPRENMGALVQKWLWISGGH